MAREIDYPDLFTYRKRSVLPEVAQKAVAELGSAIKEGSVTNSLISSYRECLVELPSSAIPRASYEIREIAGLFHYPEVAHNSSLTKLKSWWRGLFKSGPFALLQKHPDLGWLFLFHGNGHLRQAALESLQTPPRSPFEFTAIVYRLNDWVDNVRNAAESYGQQQFRFIPPDVLASSVFFLVPQALELNRWSLIGRSLLEEAIYRPDVLSCLKNQIQEARVGSVGRTLRQILRRPELDEQLQELAIRAFLPSVRAIATEALLTSQARWFTGYRQEWVNRAYGVRRRVANLESRSLEIQIDFGELFQLAAVDKSALVRKVAANALVVRRLSANPCMDRIAEYLKNDKNFSVRSIAEFYLSKRAEQLDNRD